MMLGDMLPKDADKKHDAKDEILVVLWSTFKHKYEKKYVAEKEEALRREIFINNVKQIVQHNIEAKLGKHSFHAGINSHSDWTETELAKLRGYISPRGRGSETGRRAKRAAAQPTYTNTIDVATLPTTVNWTTQGWVGPVQNQGQCGSCYSFAAAAALEAQYYNKTKTFVLLSEQNIIDCTYSYGNDGCDGGAFQYAFEYVMDGGIDSLAAYPYTSANGTSDGTCQYVASESVTSDNGWWNIEQGSELALQQAVALVGPVAVGIDASLPTFNYYRSGVYEEAGCTAADIDHAVTVVGYGTTSSGQDYWLIQNSWGTSWGIDGYMMMARNDGNMCGIASDAAMPVIN